MKRSVTLSLSALALALCVLAVDQWLHGSGRGYFLTRESDVRADGSVWRTEWTISVDYVALSYGRFPPYVLFPLAQRDRWQVVRWSPQYSAPPPKGDAHLLGFAWAGRHPRAADYGAFRVPMWFVCAVSAAGSVPFLLAVRRGAYAVAGWTARLPHSLRRRRWLRLGLCGGCGYDLTANVSGVCPECGTAACEPVGPSAKHQRTTITQISADSGVRAAAD